MFKQVVEKQKAQEIEPLLNQLSALTEDTSTATAIGEAKRIKEKIEKIEIKYEDILKPPPPPKPASAKPKVITKLGWVARLSADREQIKDAALMGVSQAGNDKIEIGNALVKTDIEIRFSYKKRGKTHEAILTRENVEREHYYGIIDLSDNTQLELWLKEKGLESYEGHARQIIKRGKEIIYTPLIKAFLRKEIIIS